MAQKPVKGIVWNPPTRLERAQQDLIEMHSIGVEAVKTPLIQNAKLFDIADSLGLTIYQDLPFAYLPGNHLSESIEEGKSALEFALRKAAVHPSARHFGLLSFSDTGAQASCRFLGELVQFARSRFGDKYQFYYTTFFIENDLCADRVDLVLIDILDNPALSSRLQRWKEVHPNTPIGLANIGTWFNASLAQSLPTGYLSNNSQEYQARFLEQSLYQLFAGNQPNSPEVVFVYRWRDTRLPYPSPAHNLSQPYIHPYGIKMSREQGRAAYDVVKGVYLDNQSVFAYPAGQSIASQNQWITLCIWVNLLILSIAYAYFPRFRLMARRYFSAHGFFREAVREGRELLVGPNILIFITLATAFGVCTVVILDVFRTTEAFSLLLRWLPESVSFTAVALLSQPVLLFIALAGTYGLLLSFWASTLSAISTRSRWTLLPGQSFMLVLWSQWPLLAVMIGAGVINTLEQPELSQMTTMLVAALVIIIITGMIFTLRDFWFISKSNPVLVFLSFILNPIILIVLAAGYYCIQYSDQLIFAMNVMRGY